MRHEDWQLWHRPPLSVPPCPPAHLSTGPRPTRLHGRSARLRGIYASAAAAHNLIASCSHGGSARARGVRSRRAKHLLLRVHMVQYVHTPRPRFAATHMQSITSRASPPAARAAPKQAWLSACWCVSPEPWGGLPKTKSHKGSARAHALHARGSLAVIAHVIRAHEEALCRASSAQLLACASRCAARGAGLARTRSQGTSCAGCPGGAVAYGAAALQIGGRVRRLGCNAWHAAHAHLYA